MNISNGFHFDPNSPNPIEHYVGPIEAAEFLRFDVPTVMEWAEFGFIPGHKLHHEGQTAWRFRISELAEWCKQNPDEASPKGRRKLATRNRKAPVIRKSPTAAKPNGSPNRKIS